MDIIDLSKTNSIINQYMAEIRDAEYQKNRLLFRNNIMRVGEYEAFEISKSLHYEEKDIATPLGISKVNVPTDKIVLATIFRAGLPFHQGFLNVFDHAGNAFVSAYREYKDAAHHEVGIHVKYLAYGHTLGENGGVTRCDYSLIETKSRMTWYVINICQACVSSFPT